MKISRSQAEKMLNKIIYSYDEVNISRTLDEWEKSGYIGIQKFNKDINMKDRVYNINLLDIIIEELEKINHYGEHIKIQDLMDVFVITKEKIKERINKHD